jgi:hypothetical protein
VVALVDDLERGLAERRRDPVDRRAYALYLTPPGRELLAELERAADEDEAELLTALDGSERSQLISLLQRVAESQGLTAGFIPTSNRDKATITQPRRTARLAMHALGERPAEGGRKGCPPLPASNGYARSNVHSQKPPGPAAPLSARALLPNFRGAVALLERCMPDWKGMSALSGGRGRAVRGPDHRETRPAPIDGGAPHPRHPYLWHFHITGDLTATTEQDARSQLRAITRLLQDAGLVTKTVGTADPPIDRNPQPTLNSVKGP